MSAVEGFLLLGSLLAIAAFWTMPATVGQNAVAAITACVLVFAAPVSAIWLLGSVAVTPMMMRLGNRAGRRGAIVALMITVLAVVLVASRQIEGWSGQSIVLIGGAYFTLRHVHVLMEWWLGRLEIPTFGQYARYHLFLPVIAAGPIHRLPHFERQCERRRWDTHEFFSGAERALIGLFVVFAVGNFAFAHLQGLAESHVKGLWPFFGGWILSGLDWFRLYFQFSGLTDLALGLSLMMGVRLEENFDRPWRARTLIDFWARWHMTLSHWCRDYVYVPIAAHFRAPVVGLFAAMLVLGLWHETSAYYVVWAVWQALGILITRAYVHAGDPLRFGWLSSALQAILTSVGILAWLSAARPLIHVLFGSLSP